jgi:type IV pilus assembly protein PilB
MVDTLAKDNVLLGEFLLTQGLITESQLEKALSSQKKIGGLLGKTLVELGFLGEQELMKALRSQLGVESVSLKKINIPLEVIYTIPESIAKTYKVIPLHKTGNIITVGMSDPLDLIAIDVITRSSGLKVKPVVCQLKEIEEAIEYYYQKPSFDTEQEKQFNYNAQSTEEIFGNEFSMPDEPMTCPDNGKANLTASHLVHLIFVQAAKEEAESILIEPMKSSYRIRFKLNGQFQEYYRHSLKIGDSMVCTIKNLACLDTDRHNTPQTAQFFVRIGENDLNLEITIVPTYYGENIHLRIRNEKEIKSLDKLGLQDQVRSKYTDILHSKPGIIWLVGPSESGKTSTAYASLVDFDLDTKNIYTFEKSLFQPKANLRQIQANFKNNVSHLKAIFGQQPDVLLLDADEEEILSFLQDVNLNSKTVLITLTGYSVADAMMKLSRFSTHKRYEILLNSNCILAHRLAKKICPKCREEYALSKSEQSELKNIMNIEFDKKFQGSGCPECRNSGYAGRIGLYEFCLIDDDFRNLVWKSNSVAEMKQGIFINAKYQLINDIQRKLTDGIISVEESIRIARQLD